MKCGLGVWISILAFVAVGCEHPGSAAPRGALIASIGDLDPTHDPGSPANVVLAGSSFVVDLKTKISRDQFEIQLEKHGAAIDHEQYQFSPAGFSLVRGAGETYDPPVTLLRFPMHVGDEWSWSGRLESGPDILPATAEITTELKSEYWLTEPVQSVVVHVNLVIGERRKVERELILHFSKGHGLFRREFGDSSVREPYGG